MKRIRDWASRVVVLLCTVLYCADAGGQTEVGSFDDLIPYLGSNDVHVVMTPGTYRITPADCGDSGSGLFPVAPILSFTGTNNVFDFTGVTFEFETEVLQLFGNIGVHEIAVHGEDQVLKNLTMIDIGNTRPRRTALGVLLDGRRNRVDGFNLTVRGSQPYGYGDIFGKGSGYVIKHFKHSAILVRGDDNHLLNCKVFHRAYGHGIFCQGAVDAKIEGCYVEGETRTSDDVLAEAGSGSAADDVDFRTNWGEDENEENGYTLQPGWMFSCQEDGIRAYNTGSDPEGNERNTRNMEVIDCTVKNMRSGVTIGFCDNTKYVENCVALGVENGYWVGTEGEVVDSAGNASFGPLLVDNYQNNRDKVVDLTVLDNAGRYGNEILVYTGGARHDITLRSRDEYVDPNLRIMIAGIREGLRQHVVNPTYNDFSTTDVELYNYTRYPVEMGTKSTGTSGETGGSVSDYGTGNSLTPISVSSDGGFGVLQTIQAEAFSAHRGAAIQTTGDGIRFVSAAADGQSIRFDDVFFGSGPNRFEAFVAGGAAPGAIEVRLGGVAGELIGTCPVPAGDGTWAAETVSLDEPRGKHDVYLVFKGTAGALPRLDRFRFYVAFPGWEEARGLVGHWTFDESGGSVAADSSGFGHDGSIADARWTHGISGTALSFNGSTSRVQIPAATFDSVDDEVTLAMWIYGDATQPLADSVFSAEDASGQRALNVHLPHSDAIVYWDAGHEGSSYDRTTNTATSAEIQGAWSHWVFTKNAKTGNMRIYRDGTMWHGEADLTRPITGVATATIGKNPNQSAYKGKIDDVRLYDVELMEHEVSALYNTYAYTEAGTPHSWLDAYGLVTGGDYAAAELGDPDGDGPSSGEEFRAGTNPTNGASVFRILDVGARGDDVVVDWSAVTGKTYDVWSKESLPDDAWTLETDGIPGSEPSCSSTVHAGVAAAFLHVEAAP